MPKATPEKAGAKSYHHGDLKNALIRAGIEILSTEGAGALSLRKVAQRAGVSHAAPYAHFADKQALIAAISTEGYRRLYDAVAVAARRHTGDPLRQLVEASWAYVQFALDEPDHFRITLSGLVEKEKDYPAFVEIAQKSYRAVVDVIAGCQGAGVLNPGPPELMAATVWAQVHGLVSLLLEDQLPHTVLDRFTIRAMFLFALGQITRVKIDPKRFALRGPKASAASGRR
jgi:AcrR family transcriptional regulator